MNEERRKQLNEDGSAHLTDEEMQQGYFFCFCISGDGMLCHRDTPEPGCTCDAGSKPAKGFSITIRPGKAQIPDEIEMLHEGECDEDETSRSVCEGLYADKCNDIIGLCAALRAVYAIAGEDPQVRKIVDKAIDEYGL